MKSGIKLKSGALGVLLIALFILINFAGFSENIRNFFYSFSAPAQQKLWGAGANVSDYFSSIFKTNGLKSENETLKTKNQELSQKLAEFENLKSENEAMKNALGIGLNNEFRLFMVGVIGKEIDNDIIIVNKGAKDGLSAGLPVITGQKVLVGKISEANDRFSKITLITNRDFAFGAKIANTGTLGEAKGTGKLNMVLDRIPGDAGMKEGDQIVSTSLGGVFPDGLLIGQVKKFEKSDIEAYQKADIQPAFNLGELNNIFVIINF